MRQGDEEAEKERSKDGGVGSELAKQRGPMELNFLQAIINEVISELKLSSNLSSKKAHRFGGEKFELDLQLDLSSICAQCELNLGSKLKTRNLSSF